MRWPWRRPAVRPVPADRYNLQLAALRDRVAENRWDTYHPELDGGMVRHYFVHRIVLNGKPYAVLVSPDAQRVIRLSTEMAALLGMRDE